jgi:peptide-methionine (S)-S-oxide reductase
MSAEMEVAILGGGCFWCLDAVYRQVRGVTTVETGYAGGPLADPSHEQVAGGDTGHAHVVRLAFDPAIVSYHDLLEVFFTSHDPTTVDRQGSDIGTQYRSVIFARSPQQETVARQVIAEMAGVWDAPIVTQVLPDQPFYRASDEHQDYVARNPLLSYCALVAAPKVDQFRAMYASLAR